MRDMFSGVPVLHCYADFWQSKPYEWYDDRPYFCYCQKQDQQILPQYASRIDLLQFLPRDAL